jgi:hypothetical protein
MVKPISLRLTQRQNNLIAMARAKLDSAQRERLDRSHDATIQERARHIVERVKQQRQLRAGADNRARRAMLLATDAYNRLIEASDGEIDQSRWRSRQQRVESELSRIIRGQRP